MCRNPSPYRPLLLVAALAVACVPERIEPGPVAGGGASTVADPGASTGTKKPPAALVALAIAPEAPEVAAGAIVVFTASGTYDDGSIADLTAAATWTVDDARVGAFDRPGVFQTTGEGTTTITATIDDQPVSVTLIVAPPTLESVTFVDEAVVLDRGESLQLELVGHFSDGHEAPIVGAEFAASTASVQVDSNGLLTAVGAGAATVTATYEAHVASLVVEVQCSYPMDAADSIQEGRTLPNLSWSKVYDGSGADVGFDLVDPYCGAAGYEDAKAIIFVLSAGWCPYCPDYLRGVDANAEAIEANGGVIVYVELEDSSRRPADGDEALAHINRIIGAGRGLRLGDGDTLPTQAIGRARFVTSLPNQFVVRTSDMSVIATGQQSPRAILDLLGRL